MLLIQNHSMVFVGRDLSRSPSFNPPAMGRDTFHSTRLLKALSKLALKTSREGASTAYVGSLLQCLIALIGKNFFLTSNPNLLSFTLNPLPLVLQLQTLASGLSLPFL